MTAERKIQLNPKENPGLSQNAVVYLLTVMILKASCDTTLVHKCNSVRKTIMSITVPCFQRQFSVDFGKSLFG